MSAIERLKRERERLMRRVVDIDVVLLELAAVERRAAALLGDGLPSDDDNQLQDTKSAPDAESPGRRMRDDVAEFERVARKILTETDAPLDRTELLEKLTAAGIEVGGKDPKNTLAARMTRMADVTNVRGRGYWLNSRSGELLEIGNDEELKTLRFGTPEESSNV